MNHYFFQRFLADFCEKKLCLVRVVSGNKFKLLALKTQYKYYLHK